MTGVARQRWNTYFRVLHKRGSDLDWQGRWTEPFLEPLRQATARTVLELGCGTGHDAARLKHEGFEIIATDLSDHAIERARAKYPMVEYKVVDMSRPLPFAAESFDAIMSNVALHAFTDTVTRALFAEIGRVVKPNGLLLFHVNSTDDRELRSRRYPVVRELEDNCVLEEGGGTMHFFSEPYLRDLLRDWAHVDLTHIQIDTNTTGEPFKRVWQGITHR